MALWEDFCFVQRSKQCGWEKEGSWRKYWRWQRGMGASNGSAVPQEKKLQAATHCHTVCGIAEVLSAWRGVKDLTADTSVWKTVVTVSHHVSDRWFPLRRLLDVGLQNQVWTRAEIKLQVWLPSWVWSKCVVWSQTRVWQGSGWEEGAWQKLLCCRAVHHVALPLWRWKGSFNTER